MRNYRGITEFTKKETLASLEFFDDEYFIVMRKNRPFLAAFPVLWGNFLHESLNFEIEYITFTDLQRKNFPEFKSDTIYYIVKDSQPYYTLIQYSSDEVSAVASYLKDHFRKIYQEATLKNTRTNLWKNA